MTRNGRRNPGQGRRRIDALQSLLSGFEGNCNESPRTSPSCSAAVAEIDYEAEIERMNPKPEQQLARLAVIHSLRTRSRAYAERAGAGAATLGGFLDDCALLGRDEETSSDEKTSADAVKFMTLHSAKGLEFPHVYLVGLEEGLLPHRRSLEDAESSIAEERRLAYVGVNVAMDHLTVTWTLARMKWGKLRPSLMSRFVYEMRGEPADVAEDASEGSRATLRGDR